MRTREAVTAALLSLALVLVSGCGGGDDSPTNPNVSCNAINLTGTRTWFIRGGCEGGAVSTQQGNGAGTYDATSCTLKVDVTPPSVKNAGGTWTLNADLRNGTANVVRANTTCANTDTGSARIDVSAIIAEVRAPADPNCDCRLNYLVNIALPL
jgi:hypothetical protein